MRPELNAELLANVANIDVRDDVSSIGMMGWLAESGLVLVNDRESAERVYLEALVNRAPADKR
jgi:hypothetical protein